MTLCEVADVMRRFKGAEAQSALPSTQVIIKRKVRHNLDSD
ncbi:MAG TPA: hypothetical protein VFF49_08415 [Thermodesulfobacteriota bacterium]|nr:hypothetical protein [Thermodesulfobacteriota bacterium]